jgi:hypothetical protein
VQRIPYGHFVRDNVELSEHLMQGDIDMVTINLLGTHFSYLLYATIHISVQVHLHWSFLPVAHMVKY